MNTYGNIGNQTAGWYARRLLSHAQPVLVLEAFALTKTLPKNETKVIEFRRFRPLPNASQLVEGQTPSAQLFGYDAVQIQMRQYGAVVIITDQVTDFNKDRVLGNIVEAQGEQVGRTREALLWDIVRSGTNVQYAGNMSSRASLTKDSLLSTNEVRRAVATMMRNKAVKITRVLKPSPNYESYSVPPAYIAVTHTDAIPTLRELAGSSSARTNHFQPVNQYSNMKMVSVHEVGNFEDVRYIASPDLPAYGGATTAVASGNDIHNFYNASTGNQFDVYSTVIFGREAFGVVALRGKRGIQPIVVKPGTPDHADKLGQTGWAGWKMYFAGRILNEVWMLRLEHVLAR